MNQVEHETMGSTELHACMIAVARAAAAANIGTEDPGTEQKGGTSQ